MPILQAHHMPYLLKKAKTLVCDKPASPLTKELVRKILYDSDVKEEGGALDTEDSWQSLSVDEVIETQEELDLQELQECLETICNEEQEGTDWTPEYKLERIQGLAIDTSILERIREGRGPRDRNSPEDLVGLLLGTVPEGGDDARLPDRAYSELQRKVQNWNLTVAKCCGQSQPAEEEAEKANELIQVLRHRDIIRHWTEKRSGSPYMETRTRDLERALQTYRPETAAFKDKTPYETMAILVVNDRIAEPHLGFELRENMIRVMWMEEYLSLEQGLRTKKAILKAEIEAARQDNDQETVRRAEKQYRRLKSAMLEESASNVLRDLRCARRNLRGEVLRELQDLTVSYAGLKPVVVDKILAAPQLLNQLCEEADSHVNRVMQQYDTVEAEIAIVETAIDVVKEVNGVSCSRLRKFSAGDIKDAAERERTRKQRMEEPETARVMFKMTQDMQIVHERTQAVRQKFLDKLDTSLQEVHEALKKQYLAYSELLDAVDGEDEDAVPAANQGRAFPRRT
ncbi:hypothetical protein P154DRAFT_526989 [Amniculicola lignicola CBS 123094]|uniref:Uncharacterized protein n=1 Tax=Amniculicola lignicola CBS 123094 TaxID=1392246 RepID=A0A6A5VYR5_9PLEO|nr:hypothetical protein P154DRAFT_526989 [Amniculicola lignicola CBS 123094]